MAHYIVVTDSDGPGDGVALAATYIESLKDKYPDTSFKMTGVLSKYTKQWFSPANTDEEPFSEQTVMELMAEVMSTSPMGTTDESVIKALESRNRQDLKKAHQHMHWLYTTAGIDDTNLNIWVDSIFEGELDMPGITNITTEYESDAETTYMIQIETEL